MLSVKMLCFVCLVGLATGATVKFAESDITSLKEQVALLKADVAEEKKRDESLLQERVDDAKYAEKEEAAAILAYKMAQNATAAAQIEHDAEHKILTGVKLEYATNRNVRDRETKMINSISDEVANLVKIGKGKIGDKGMAAQASALLQTGLANVLQMQAMKTDQQGGHTNPASPPGASGRGGPRYPGSHEELLQTDSKTEDFSAQLAAVMSTVARASPHTESMQKNLNALLAKLKTEESADSARVEGRNTKAQVKTTKLAEAKAAEETRLELMTEAKAARVAADAALAEQKTMFKDASVVRQKELDLLSQVSEELAKLLSIRKPQGIELLQTYSSTFDEVLTAMKGKLDAMKADVQMEETLQLKLKTKKEAQVAGLMLTSASAETIYKQQKAETKELQTKHNKVKGEMESAEGQLAAERATALQESRMIKQLRVTIKQFSTSSVTALGDCPEHEGLVCSGQGSCNTTDYTCKCKLGRAGKACEFCKFGYKFVGGICLKSDFNMPDLSLLQGSTMLDTISPADMNVMLLQLQTGARTGRVYAEMSSIDQLLTALERKLKDAEKQLIEARDRQVLRYEKAKEKWVAAQALEKTKHTAYLTALDESQSKAKSMRMIRAMYDYEHPLRTKELESIDKTIGLLNTLGGMTPAPTAPAEVLIQLPVVPADHPLLSSQ